jgi:L-methionine (R)-S-oxide reductase
MAEEFFTNPSAPKAAQYQLLLKQISSLCEEESNPVANLSNICAALKTTFGWFWIGFYLVDKEQNNLVLGPFQGPIACTRIAKGKGVCGTAWDQKQVLNIPDVNAFPGHIACSALSKSEIVVPILSPLGEVIGVLDVDSDTYDTFDETDEQKLKQLCDWIGTHIIQ